MECNSSQRIGAISLSPMDLFDILEVCSQKIEERYSTIQVEYDSINCDFNTWMEFSKFYHDNKHLGKIKNIIIIYSNSWKDGTKKSILVSLGKFNNVKVTGTDQNWVLKTLKEVVGEINKYTVWYSFLHSNVTIVTLLFLASTITLYSIISGAYPILTGITGMLLLFLSMSRLSSSHYFLPLTNFRL